MTGLYHLMPSDSFHAVHGGWLTMSEDSKAAISSADATALAMDGKWSNTNVGLYRSALLHHRAVLDGFRPNGVRFLAVVGAGKETIMDVEFDDDLFRDDWHWGYDWGDGTVPLLSAAQGSSSAPPKGAFVPRWYRCGVSHDELSGHTEVLEDVSDFIDGTIQSPRRLSSSPCGTSGYEVSARSASPSAARTASTAASRRG